MNDTLPYLSSDPSEVFLEVLPGNNRGFFKSCCLTNGPRSGCNDPHEIASSVRSVYARRSDAAALAIVRAMDDFPDELHAFLLSILDHDLQPAEVRLQRKQRGRQEGLRRWMERQRPSVKQLEYLNGRLRYQGPPPASMAEASRLIDELREGRR